MAPTLYPLTLEVTTEDASRRLDQFLVAKLPEISRARIQQVIEQEKVRVNGAAKASSAPILC